MTKSEAMLRGIVMKAMQGNGRAWAALIEYTREHGQFEPDPTHKCIEVEFVNPDGTHATMGELEEFRKFKEKYDPFVLNDERPPIAGRRKMPN